MGFEPTQTVWKTVVLSANTILAESPMQVTIPPPSAYKADALPDELMGHAYLSIIAQVH